MTTTELWRKLVEARIPCPDTTYGSIKDDPGLHNSRCHTCDGLGTVLALPGLSEKCWCMDELAHQCGNSDCAALTKNHLPCERTGRISKPEDAWLLLDEMWKAGFEWGGSDSHWLFSWRGDIVDFVKSIQVTVTEDAAAACYMAALRALEARYDEAHR